jgi:hypothetical protein
MTEQKMIKRSINLEKNSMRLREEKNNKSLIKIRYKKPKSWKKKGRKIEFQNKLWSKIKLNS